MSETIEALIPEDTAVEIKRLELRMGGRVPPAFERDAELIASKWQKRCSENPYLFNGKVFLESKMTLRDGLLSGEAVELDYASFLHWRGNPPFQAETALHHAFPLAAIVSSDRKLVAVRSANTTINSGLVYFAAGMFDSDDVTDNQLDPFGNMRREVLEETGLNLGDMVAEGALVAFRTGRFVALFQKFTSRLTSESLVARVREFTRTQTTPEIEDAVVIDDVSHISDNMPGYMQAYCRWHLTD